MSSTVSSIVAEYRRYKALGDSSIEQLKDEELTIQAPNGGNSIATLVWHVGGNLRSRFTDFLTSDGEKPWRRRDTEFEEGAETRTELLALWESGWSVLFETLGALTDADLGRSVRVRTEPQSVTSAILRQVSHYAYHVGQIVTLARARRGAAWTSLTIPKGQSRQHVRGSYKRK